MTQTQMTSDAPSPMLVLSGANDLRLAADAWGNPDHPLVLLMHGGGQTRHAWRGTGEALAAQGYRVIAYDARGHGESDWAPDGDYSRDSMVKDMNMVMHSLQRTSAVLVGASMGGITGLLAIGDHGFDAHALVLVDVAPRIEPGGVEKIHAFMSDRPDGFDTLQDVADAIQAYQPHRPAPPSLDGLAKNVRVGAGGRYFWHWDPRFRTGRVTSREHRQAELERAARKLTVPTLLVRGGMSDVLSEDGVRAFLELCPHAEYVNVPGAAHMVVGDRNDTFASAVSDFLRRTVPAGPASSP